MISKFLLPTLILLCITTASAQELRGVWFARDSLGSRESIARAMDSIAANNFNVVYVNCWSRGYPLWQSQVFKRYTGSTIDTLYLGRDILAECIAEGHRRGLLVEAWMEYGFVGGYTGYYPGTSGKGKIFDLRPSWVAKQQNGTEIDGSSFYWMTHTRKDVQDFLIALCTEIARNYDVDGIELDRCRYSSLSYGYDTYTDSLYRAENSNTPPPATTNNAGWIRWRADKLNAFIARAYDSIKAVNANLNVGNAPSQYSSSSYSAYNSFCQDWMWWINNNKVDNLNVQMYVASPTTFGSYAAYIKAQLGSNFSKAYPSYAFKPNNVSLTESQLLGIIDTTRGRGFGGNGIWYYSHMFPFTALLKSTRYASWAYVPYESQTWRVYRDTVIISNTADALRSGSWASSSNQGYSGNSLYASSGAAASIDYYFDVPADGWYEVYAYQVVSSNRTTAAEHKLYNYLNTLTTVTVDQTNSLNSGFVKIGDAELRYGRRRVLTITNAGVTAGKLVSADGAMILLNRRLAPLAESPLPVELVSFTARIKGRTVFLQWQTATEENSARYVVERKQSPAGAWLACGTVPAAGTANAPREYSWHERDLNPGNYSYRLKMLDTDGSYTYSKETTVAVLPPGEFAIRQNYPNPFNPSTAIEVELPADADCRITVYNHLGAVAAVLHEGRLEAGIHSFTFTATGLASGVYYCRYSAGNFTSIRKMSFIK